MTHATKIEARGILDAAKLAGRLVVITRLPHRPSRKVLPGGGGVDFCRDDQEHEQYDAFVAPTEYSEKDYQEDDVMATLRLTNPREDKLLKAVDGFLITPDLLRRFDEVGYAGLDGFQRGSVSGFLLEVASILEQK